MEGTVGNLDIIVIYSSEKMDNGHEKYIRNRNEQENIQKSYDVRNASEIIMSSRRKEIETLREALRKQNQEIPQKCNEQKEMGRKIENTDSGDDDTNNECGGGNMLLGARSH